MVFVHLVPIRPTAATADDARRLAAALLDDPRPDAAVTAAAWLLDESGPGTDAASHDGELAVVVDGMAAAQAVIIAVSAFLLSAIALGVSSWTEKRR